MADLFKFDASCVEVTSEDLFGVLTWRYR